MDFRVRDKAFLHRTAAPHPKVLLSPKLLGNLIRLFLGGLLVFSGVSKLLGFNQFVVVVESYQLIPRSVVGVFSLCLLSMEVACGFLLLFGLLREVALLITCTLFAGFAIVISITMYRGLEIGCGCLPGLTTRKIGIGTLSVDLVLLALSLYTLYNLRRNGHLSQRFNEPSKWVGGFMIVLTLAGSGSAFSTISAKARMRGLQSRLEKLQTIFDTNATSNYPFSFPADLSLDRAGNIYIADSELATVFKFDRQGKLLWKVEGTPQQPKRFQAFADFYVDDRDQVCVLDGFSPTIYFFTSSGQFVRSTTLKHIVRSFVINRFGEIIANSNGPYLFDMYSPSGRYIRSFGERIKYSSGDANYEFNTGHIAAGPKGEIYFSFFYPPLIRAYSRDGKPLWEKAISFDKKIPDPRISRSGQGGNIAISLNYPLSSLDLDVDGSGRIYCLVAGSPKVIALTEGSDRLDVFSATGERLDSLKLPSRFHQMAVRQGELYLLANRKPIKLERFSFYIRDQMDGYSTK